MRRGGYRGRGGGSRRGRGSNRRRRRYAYNYTHNPLKSAQTILTQIENDKFLLIDNDYMFIGIKNDINKLTNNKVECNEVSYKEFANGNIDISNIIYISLKMKRIKNNNNRDMTDIIYLYDRRSGIDRVTISGNTKKPQLWRRIRKKYIPKKKLSENEEKRQIWLKQQKLTQTTPEQNDDSEEKKVDDTNNANDDDDDIMLDDDDEKTKLKPTAGMDIMPLPKELCKFVVSKQLSMDLDKLSKEEYKFIAKDTIDISKRGFYKVYFDEANDMDTIKHKHLLKYYKSMQTKDSNRSPSNQQQYTRQYRSGYDRRSGTNNNNRDKAPQPSDNDIANTDVVRVRRDRSAVNNAGGRRRRGGYNSGGGGYGGGYGGGRSREPGIVEIATNDIDIGKLKLTYKLVNVDEAKLMSHQRSKLYHHNDEIECNEDKWLKFDTVMNIEIINESTLNACYRLCNDDDNYDIDNPCALSFASARQPGGGFLNGCNGQEESICRSSVLYYTLCKFQKSFYKFHKNEFKSMLYSNNMIYSPNVCIFRDDNGNLLKSFYHCSFISSCAVNSKYYLKRNDPKQRKESTEVIRQTMRERCDKILNIACQNKHDAIVLGSFGCGVYKNDPNMIADIFAVLLSSDKYKYRFKKVIFAVLEFSKKERIFDAFHYAIKRRFKY